MLAEKEILLYLNEKTVVTDSKKLIRRSRFEVFLTVLKHSDQVFNKKGTREHRKTLTNATNSLKTTSHKIRIRG